MNGTMLRGARQQKEKTMRRRNFVTGLAACTAGTPHHHDTPLRDLAAARNIVFGTEVTLSDITKSASYARLVARECAIITPGLEAKWAAVEPAEQEFNFAPLDAVVRFADAHALRLHMHNLIWAVGLPAWTINALDTGRGAAVMSRHIATTVGRYRGRIDSWDVINELVDPRWPSAADGICNTPWRRALGAAFVPAALRETRAADPNARLLINDDDLEYDGPDREKKRNIYLRLIETWIRQGVPLTGFGLEAHIKPWLPIAARQYRRFLRELAGFGLALYVTELDVCDRTLPADMAARDRAVAACAKNYLDIVLDEPAVRTVIIWGLSDATTWMLRDRAGQRADGLAPRPLPYDVDLRPKPMRGALAAAFAAAPYRPG
jgi:endo-1,4-beta-xylanase